MTCALLPELVRPLSPCRNHTCNNQEAISISVNPPKGSNGAISNNASSGSLKKSLNEVFSTPEK